MFLLEVRDTNNNLFKRRIATTLSDIEDWVDSNAHKWAKIAVKVEHDYYGTGVVRSNDNMALYTYHATSIATI